MPDEVRSLFVRGIAAAKAGEMAEAKKYLEWVLRRSAPSDMELDAYLWLAEIEPDTALKRGLLENALAINPLEPRARRALGILNGDITPEEIVDPDNLPEIERGERVNADRFVCPSCGGRMSFAADGRSLTCDYCEMTKSGNGSGAPDEQDFILALSTVKGHKQPETARSFNCDACGAGYILAADDLTLTCHHCGSVYVVKETETNTWIPPGGVIPFSVTQDQAEEAMRTRSEEGYGLTPKAGDRPPVGVYLPAWTFDLGGTITWQGYETDEDGQVRQKHGSYPVAIDDLLIPANSKLSDLQEAELNHFDLKQIVPYNPAYLADWPAETYGKTLAQAALEARERAFKSLKPTVTRIDGASASTLSSARMMVVSYKLILLPFWVGYYEREEDSFELIVNGQSGEVRERVKKAG